MHEAHEAPNQFAFVSFVTRREAAFVAYRFDARATEARRHGDTEMISVFPRALRTGD